MSSFWCHGPPTLTCDVLPGAEIIQRAKLELQPVGLFLRLFIGYPQHQMLLTFFTSRLPSCFASWQSAKTVLLYVPRYDPSLLTNFFDLSGINWLHVSAGPSCTCLKIKLLSRKRPVHQWVAQRHSHCPEPKHSRNSPVRLTTHPSSGQS